MVGHRGAKLLFMGGEFAQHHEWQHDYSLDWNENNGMQAGVALLLADLNKIYQNEAALTELDFNASGFKWVAADDVNNAVFCWLRKSNTPGNDLLFAANFTPVVHQNYRVAVAKPGYYVEIFNSDNLKYGGSDVLNKGELDAYPIPMHGESHSLCLTLPPLAGIIIKFAADF